MSPTSTSVNAALLAVATLSGCAPGIHVVPAPPGLAERNPSKVICVIENPNVAVPGFLEAYRSALEARGYAVKVVKKTPQVAACPLTSRYAALRSGLTQLELYWEGRPIAQATHTGAAESEDEVRLLVSRLLP